MEFGGASCSHLGQRVDADTANSPAGEFTICVGLEATPELEDRDCCCCEAAGAQESRDTVMGTFTLEEIYEGVGVRDNYPTVHGVSRAA